MSQILSQDEVDALLQGISGGAVEIETGWSNQLSGVQGFDFTNRISRGRLPTLEMINEQFARLFRTTISSTLRRSVDVSVSSTEMVNFSAIFSQYGPTLI